MTELTYTLHRRAQLAAIAELRWRMFVNGLRSKRGKMELVSRVIVTAAFAFGGLGGFALATGFAWYFVSHGEAEMLPLLLWPIFFFWQVFPVMATAFTNNPDSGELLRFPLNYSSYFLIRLAYGLCDPASALGCVALFGVLLGVSFARPTLFPWALLVLFTYALFNLILMQTVFAWLERWLAQRRTREIMGVLFILVMLSFQLIGPMMQRVEKQPRPEFHRATQIITQVQAVLPPGLAADAIAQTSHAQFLVGFTSLLFLGALTAGVGSLLHIRLRAQFRGENLSEAAARPAVPQAQGLQVGWNLSGFSQPVAAVFEKEVRYLARSGPMLLTLVMPIFMLVIFRLGPMNAMHQSHFLARTPDMAFPGAAAYSLLILTNLVFNSFGGDAAGVQFFYASPVSFRQIMLGKNLTHAGILAGCDRRGTPVRGAFELHGRQPALDLFAEETRLRDLRPSERLADDRSRKPGRAGRDRGLRLRGVRYRAALQESVDRRAAVSGAGGDLNPDLPYGPASHGRHRHRTPRGAAGGTLSGVVA